MSSKLASQQLKLLTAAPAASGSATTKGKAAGKKHKKTAGLVKRHTLIKALDRSTETKEALVQKNKKYFQRNTVSKKAASLLEKLTKQKR